MKSTALLLIDFQEWIAQRFGYASGRRAANYAMRAAATLAEAGGRVILIRYLDPSGLDGGIAAPATAYLDGVDRLPFHGEFVKPGRSSFEGTSLAGYLRTAGIHSVLISGIVLEAGVLRTALDAQALGFATAVLLRGVVAESEPGAARALDCMEGAGIRLLDALGEIQPQPSVSGIET